MKIVLITVTILGFTLNCFAAQRVYYDPATNKQVVDLSGNKDPNLIKQQYGLSDNYQVEVVDEQSEAVRIENNKLTKYNYQEENQKIKVEKDKQIKQKETEIKTKLGLSDKELESLKEVLK